MPSLLSFHPVKKSKLRRLFCKHVFPEQVFTVAHVEPWRLMLVEVPGTGDAISVMRKHYQRRFTCEKCGEIKIVPAYDQKAAEGDPYENAKPSKSTTNDATYGNFGHK